MLLISHFKDFTVGQNVEHVLLYSVPCSNSRLTEAFQIPDVPGCLPLRNCCVSHMDGRPCCPHRYLRFLPHGNVSVASTWILCLSSRFTVVKHVLWTNHEKFWSSFWFWEFPDRRILASTWICGSVFHMDFVPRPRGRALFSSLSGAIP